MIYGVSNPINSTDSPWQEFLALNEEDRGRAVEITHSFIKAVNHKLTQPISALRCCLDLVSQNLKPEKQQEYLALAIGEAERTITLMHLFQDLLEAEIPSRDNKTIEMSSMLRAMVTSLAPLAESRNVKLNLHESECAFVNMSEERLLRALGSVISNCLETTYPGGTVTLSLRRLPDSVRVDVEDGSLSTVTDVETLFDPFSFSTSRMEMSHVSNMPLAVANRLLTVAGGSLSASLGSLCERRFSICLPLAEAKSVDEGLKGTAQASHTAGQKAAWSAMTSGGGPNNTKRRA